MNLLGKILGLIDGNIDLGAITGIFGRIATLVARVPELIARARALAKKFQNDPELKQFFDDVQDLVGDIPGLLKLDNGQEISAEEIRNLRTHGAALYRRAGKDLPRKPDDPPPPPPPPPPTFRYMDVLTGDPGDVPLETGNLVYRSEADHAFWTVHDGTVGGARRPDSNNPRLPDGRSGDWRLLRTVRK